MSRSQCPAPKCGATIPRTMWACRRHWYQLPAELRRSIWGAYRAGRVLETIEQHLDRSYDAWTGGRA